MRKGGRVITREGSIYIDPVPTGTVNRWGHKIVSMTCSACGSKTIGREIDLLRVKGCRHIYKNTDIKIVEMPYGRISHTFDKMVRRCYDISSVDYRWYGGKGIRICDQWLSNDMAFYNWYKAQPGWDKGLTIDRIDGDGDYCPSNCKLIPREENARWKSSTNGYTVNGVTKTGRQWSEHLGLGINHINRYARKHGRPETLRYIESVQKATKKSA